jgi:signal peptidase I
MKTNSRKEEPGLLGEFLFLLTKIAIACIALVLIFTFMFGICRYQDATMNPAVKDGDLVLWYRPDKDYTASDLLVLEYEGKLQVRRVIATAGDVVDITEDGLFINGSLQQEPDIYEDTLRYDTGVEFPMIIEEGQVFVLGDNRTRAVDSRVYGAVDIKNTLGKVMTIIRRRGL